MINKHEGLQKGRMNQHTHTHTHTLTHMQTHTHTYTHTLADFEDTINLLINAPIDHHALLQLDIREFVRSDQATVTRREKH